MLLEDFLINGDCFYFSGVILSESVCTVYYYCGLFLMAKPVAAQMSCVHSFVYLWYIFMYLDGALIILTVCKMKLCAAESVTLWVVLGGANVGGEF